MDDQTSNPTALQTERLTLRAARKTDLDDLHAIYSDEEVMKYYAWTPPHKDLDETERELDYLIASPNNGVLAFVMELTPSSASSLQHDVSKVIGRVGIRSSEQAMIGYVVNRSYWGKGYMNEALTVLLRYLWEYGVQRITAQVDPRNERSMNVLKMLGFEETGRKEKVREVDGVEHGIVYFALAKEKGDKQSVEE